jgi:hypothetical protein
MQLRRFRRIMHHAELHKFMRPRPGSSLNIDATPWGSSKKRAESSKL